MKAFFTGHRHLLYTSTNINAINNLIDLALEKETKIFLVGMALGTDQLAAQILSKRRLKWTAIVPCSDQSLMWKRQDKSRYKKLLDSADSVKVLYPKYFKGVMHRRNLYMVKQSDLCLAVYNGSKAGGTFHAVNLAIAYNLPTVIFNPNTGKFQVKQRYQQLSLF